MSSISIKNVSFYYRDGGETHLALEDISLDISSGEFVCIVGHSGCGKSTLLSLLAGLNSPSSGEILIDGCHITEPGTDRAMVFQHYSLFPWMRVRKNVEFSILHSRRNISKQQASKEAVRYLSEVGMADAADKFPFQLSGGMQQRVAIARALAMESEILLLDEPFGALDARNRQELQGLLLKLWHDASSRKTVVFVTHDLNEALLLADRVVFMRPRHIAKVENVDLKRPRDLERLSLDPEFRNMRSRLMDLFYDEMDEDGSTPRPSQADAQKDSILKTDDEQGILHFDDIQAGE